MFFICEGIQKFLKSTGQNHLALPFLICLQGANAQLGLVMYNANSNPGIISFVLIIFAFYPYDK